MLGILNGTSALLLTFDDHEVRKILNKCRNVLDYIPVAEVVESLPDTVTYIKNLSPALLQMAKAVDNRIPDLTHITHAELLQKHVASVKELATNLPNSMRAFVAATQKNSMYSRSLLRFFLLCLFHMVCLLYTSPSPRDS